MTKLTDDNSSDTVYAWNVLGQLTQKSYENSKTVSYSYDLNGNVTEITDQSGTVTDLGYDDLDRLITRDLTLATGVGGDTDEDFAYDALGRLTQAQDDDSIVSFTYDSLSRVLTETQGSNPLGSTGKTVTYTYDDDGNRTKLDYPSGFDANETRDALGRLTEVKDASNVSIAAFDLYGGGLRRKKTSFGNGTTSEIGYDGFRRPVEINHKTSGGSEFAGQDYLWDKNDNPLIEKRSHESGKGDVYSYDKANRLVKVLTDVIDPAAEIATPGSQSYTDKLEYDMDDVFNLTAYKVTPQGGSTATTSYTTNAMNEYTAVGGTSHTYTDNGALAADGTYTYKYDGHDRLIEVKQGTTTVATYAYDALGLGRRTKKTVGSAVTRYVYAGLQPVEEYDGSGGLQRLFVFGERIDQILAMESPDHADVDQDSNTSEVLRFNYHVQLIGSVTHVTAPSGSVAESYRYDPYGKPTIKDRSGTTVTASAIKNPYLFTARQLDEETGLYYYRARHYSAVLRRFIQRDPLEYVDGPNAIAYASCVPTAVSDPTGLDTWIQITGDEGGTWGIDNHGKHVPPPTSPPPPPPKAPFGPAWGFDVTSLEAALGVVGAKAEVDIQVGINSAGLFCYVEVWVFVGIGAGGGGAVGLPTPPGLIPTQIVSPPPPGGDQGWGGGAMGGVAASPIGVGPGVEVDATGSSTGGGIDPSVIVGLGIWGYVGGAYVWRVPCSDFFKNFLPGGGGGGGGRTGGGGGGGTGCGGGPGGGWLSDVADWVNSLWSRPTFPLARDEGK